MLLVIHSSIYVEDAATMCKGGKVDGLLVSWINMILVDPSLGCDS
jgi:hypothetical protein